MPRQTKFSKAYRKAADCGGTDDEKGLNRIFMKLLVINGPNLNMLGIREKGIYGTETYEDLKRLISQTCDQLNIQVEIYQSNHEGAIVDKIQEAYGRVDGIIINPAAYTHTSVAILDALKAVNLPAVEVHLSNIFERESFRHLSYAGMACIKSIIGHGFEGYREAILFLKENLEGRNVSAGGKEFGE